MVFQAPLLQAARMVYRCFIYSARPQRFIRHLSTASGQNGLSLLPLLRAAPFCPSFPTASGPTGLSVAFFSCALVTLTGGGIPEKFSPSGNPLFYSVGYADRRGS
jgi:hypothetical protein